MTDPAHDLLAALAADDWDAARLVLHPYVRWQTAGGATIRGRTNVLGLLREQPGPDLPASIELRDGQIYRWNVRA